MIRALAMVGILVTGQAHALTPLPECVTDGAEREAGLGEYSVNWHGSGFVAYTAWSGDYRMFLDDCKRQLRLVMTVEPQVDRDATAQMQFALDDAIYGALNSKQRYTMAQIEAIARKVGATTQRGRASYVSCACELWGDED
jgi:hypothetical protein